jgi:hypothetical protein
LETTDKPFGCIAEASYAREKVKDCEHVSGALRTANSSLAWLVWQALVPMAPGIGNNGNISNQIRNKNKRADNCHFIGFTIMLPRLLAQCFRPHSPHLLLADECKILVHEDSF